MRDFLLGIAAGYNYPLEPVPWRAVDAPQADFNCFDML